MIYVHYVADIPQGTHYVILENKSTFIPGDERSRTNPGHGYGESTEYSVQMRVTMNYQEWEDECLSLLKDDPDRTKFTAYKVVGIPSMKLESKIVFDLPETESPEDDIEEARRRS